jgi:hypothetical protein
MRCLVFALLLSIALANPGWSQGGAQRAWGPAASVLFAPVRPNHERMSILADTTPRRIRPTYWKEGAIVGGLTLGILGAVFGAGICAYSETEGNCTGATLLGLFGGVLTGGTLGALIGGQFPKASPSDSANSAVNEES